MADFGRRVEVQIGQPGEAGRSLRSWQVSGEPGLRIDAVARLTQAPSDDTAEVTIYNPAPATLEELQRPGAVVRLLAGYPDSIAQIISGRVQPRSLRVEKSGPDRIASWVVTDGGLDLRETTVTAVWAQTVTATEVVRFLAREAGLAVGVLTPGRPVAYFDGYVVWSTLRAALDAVAADTDSRWSVQSGVVQLWPRDGVRYRRATRLTPTTGLIGSPRAVDRGRWEVVGLLRPEMRPGDAFAVASTVVTGTLIAEDVQHQVSSGYARDFYSVITARREGEA